ncbi:MAG: DUF6370 family protein [Verrucomicrobiota bacterium]
MKTVLSIIVMSAAAGALMTAVADESVTVTGNLVCAHCDVGIESKCATALKATDAVYLLDGAAVEKFFEGDEHEDVRTVTATGAVSKVGDNSVLTATKIEAAES